MSILLIAIEAVVMCFILLLICVIGIANGPAGLVVFYEKDVQERAIKLGLTTQKKIKRDSLLVILAMYLPVIFLTPLMVYGLNGVSGFWDGFLQMTIVLLLMGLFDRLFIDWYWVGHTRAWEIPGTEDLKPYIPRKTLVVKWVFTIIGLPLIALAIAAVVNII